MPKTAKAKTSVRKATPSARQYYTEAETFKAQLGNAILQAEKRWDKSLKAMREQLASVDAQKVIFEREIANIMESARNSVERLNLMGAEVIYDAEDKAIISAAHSMADQLNKIIVAASVMNIELWPELTVSDGPKSRITHVTIIVNQKSEGKKS